MPESPRDYLPIAPGNTNFIVFRNSIRLRLFDRVARALDGVAYKIVIGDQVLRGTADGDGYVIVYTSSGATRCSISWSPVVATPDGDPLEEVYEYTRDVSLDVNDDDTVEGLRARLNNLGYTPEAPLEECIQAFQEDYGIIVPNGDPNDAATCALLTRAHAMMTPRARPSQTFDVSDDIDPSSDADSSAPEGDDE